jgi:hypothetical protein
MTGGSWLLVLAGWLAPAAEARQVTFDDHPAGQAPRGFSCVLTGRGRTGAWTVVKDETAPTAPHVLAQADEDATGYRFPVCVLDSVWARDVDVSVRFKPFKGSADQAAGLVWRFRDKDNYYVLRANALENNVVLYKVEAGKRSDLKPKGAGMFSYGKKARVPSGAWGTLRVIARGSVFEAYLDERKLFELEDGTFLAAGKVGVWTKSDSVTYFDDLRIVVEAQ